MPSDIMDQRHMSSLCRPSLPSSFSMEEAQFPSEVFCLGTWILVAVSRFFSPYDLVVNIVIVGNQSF